MTESNLHWTGMAVVLAGLAAPPAWAINVEFDNVVYRGNVAPGTGGERFHGVTQAGFDGLDRVMFLGSLSTTFGLDPATDYGVWSQGSMGLKLDVREGDAAPGAPAGSVFADFVSPVRNDADHIAFQGYLTGPAIDASNATGLWAEGGSAAAFLSLVAQQGDLAPLPSTGPRFLTFLDGIQIDSSANVAVRARLSGPGVNSLNDVGIWTGDSAGLQYVAREGETAATFPFDVTYAELNGVGLNRAGQLAISTRLTGPGINSNNDEVLYTGTPGSLEVVARDSDAAPGLAPGVTLGRVLGGSVNNNGTALFQATLAGPGVSNANNNSFWTGTPDGIQLAVREGDAAPGTSDGQNFSDLSSVLFNDAGDIAFRARLTGPGVTADNDFGVWAKKNGTTQLIAREGQAAPGTPTGVVFASLSAEMAFSHQGDTAFTGTVTGPGVTPENDEGLWAVGPGGVLTLIVREGDQIDINDPERPEFFPTVSEVSLAGGQEFNNGKLLIVLNDGAGLVVSRFTGFGQEMPGDFDGSGQVEQADLDLILQNWGVDTDAQGIPAGWLNDLPVGLIEQTELDHVLQNWGATSAPDFRAAVVPEPFCLGWLGLAGCAALSRRR